MYISLNLFVQHTKQTVHFTKQLDMEHRKLRDFNDLRDFKRPQALSSTMLGCCIPGPKPFNPLFPICTSNTAVGLMYTCTLHLCKLYTYVNFIHYYTPVVALTLIKHWFAMTTVY